MNVFEMAQMRLQKAANLINVEAACEVLSQPKRSLHVNFPVRMDDGSVRMFEGWRIQHQDALGPCKGGIRFHPRLSESEVKALSLEMTVKCAMAHLPLGGGKGGVRCNADELSVYELERVSRTYVEAIADMIGPLKDIPAPDMYTSPQVMGWMMDAYSRLSGHHVFDSFTGKPPILGGSEERVEATAQGGVYVLESAFEHKSRTLENATVAIQGYGNAGKTMARLLSEKGCRIVAVCDSKDAICDPDGLDIVKTESAKEEGTLSDSGNQYLIGHEELLALDVDILIPAALEKAIHKDNAGSIKSGMILELANGPTTPEADDMLKAGNKEVIPDLLANAGGVIVSHLEWIQNRTMEQWDENRIKERLKNEMVAAYKKTKKCADEFDTDIRMGVYVTAVRRLTEALKARGQ